MAAGVEVAQAVFRRVDPELEISGSVRNGDVLGKGDLIMSIDGKAVERQDALTMALSRKKAGDTLDLLVYRGGKKSNVKVTLGAAEDDRF